VNFQYSVLRVVPSTIADECLNVGIVVKHGDQIDLRRAPKLDRIRAAFPSIDKNAVELCLAYLDELLQAEPDLDLYALSMRTRGALVQVSPPATTVGASIRDEADELFDLYVSADTPRSNAYEMTAHNSKRRVGGAARAVAARR